MNAKFNFSEALNFVREGHKIFREGWNGKGLWLEIQIPDEHSKMTLPYIFLNYPTDEDPNEAAVRVPWVASQTDILAEDWKIKD